MTGLDRIGSGAHNEAGRCPICGQLLPPPPDAIFTADDLVAALMRPIEPNLNPPKGMRQPRRRDVYEGADSNGKRGSGRYFVTYGGGEATRTAIDEALARGLIRRKWEIDGCWCLVDEAAHANPEGYREGNNATTAEKSPATPEDDEAAHAGEADK